MRSRSTNVSGQTYGFMAMTPIKPGEEQALRDYLESLRDRGSPLAKLPRTHMGRWVIIEDFYNHASYKQRREEHLELPYLVFTSNFDGDLDSYLDELCEQLAPEAEQIWGRCIGCPASAKGVALKTYLKHNQIDCGVFFSAYGHASVHQVRTSLRRREHMIAFARSAQGMAPPELQAAFVEEFVS